MYKAKFGWHQNIKFEIYKKILRYMASKKDSNFSFGGNDGVSNENNGEDTVPIIMYLDILEDFSYEIKSNFQGYAEAIGSVSGIAGSILDFFSKLNTLSAVGGISTDSQEYMKFQVWKDTEPFRMSLKVVLDTKTDPFLDVYAPAIALCSMAIMTPVTDDKNMVSFVTPGINAGNMKTLAKRNPPQESKTKTTGDKKKEADGSTIATESKDQKNARIKDKNSSKIIDTFSIVSTRVDKDTSGGLEYPNSDFPIKDSEIPLLIIKECFIESAKPTFSQQRTSSGIPLRCDLEITIQSVYSANDSMFSYLSQKKNSVKDQAGDLAKIATTNIFR